MPGNHGYYADYLPLVTIVVVGVLLVGAMFAGNRLLRPSYATPEKLLTYECGVDPVGADWAQSQIRYYVFTYLYVVFAVDAVFLFPWATVFAAPGYGATTLVEMFIFLGFLAVGLLYAYLYVIFAVDAVFLFPWATVFAALGWVSVGEMGVFIGFLAVGLVYAWRQGVLTWT